MIFKNQDCYDFLATIPNNTIDLILTDPPYEISKPTNFQNGELKHDDTDRFRISMDFGQWDKEQQDLKKLCKEYYRVLKPHGTIIIFYDIWKISYLKEALEEEKFKQIRFIEWIKTNPVPINSSINYLTNAREIALTGVKQSKPIFHSKYDNGIYQYPIYQGKDRIHPTQKPLNLFIELLQKHSNVGDVVLDTFAGSGTTPVACLKTNRQFYGCELDTNYYNQALKRINDNKN